MIDARDVPNKVIIVSHISPFRYIIYKFLIAAAGGAAEVSFVYLNYIIHHSPKAFRLCYVIRWHYSVSLVRQ